TISMEQSIDRASKVIARIKHLHDEEIIKTLRTLLVLLEMHFLRILLDAVFYFIAFLQFTTSVSAKVVRFIASRLIGHNRLRHILVWWGIIFFIVGNLLQF